MAKVINFLGKCDIKENNFIKSGSTCVVWTYTDSNGIPLVIKLCTKRIEYFKSFPNKTAEDFRSLICDDFRSLLLPIKEILYEDRNYFVYTQEKIKVLDLSEIDVDVFTKILGVVKVMFANGILTSDLISSNFGWDSNHQLYLLDYHDMKSVNEFFQKAKWSKIVRCLLEYSSYLLYQKGFEAYTSESIIDWKSEETIVMKKFGAEYFPSHFVTVYKSLATTNINKIIRSITNCQKILHGEIPDMVLERNVSNTSQFSTKHHQHDRDDEKKMRKMEKIRDKEMKKLEKKEKKALKRLHKHEH